MREIVTPEWVKHAVFYQIFPDRFAKSDRLEKPNNIEPWDSDPTTYGYKGGDLLGVLEHLDHIQDLGATAIYFCPIFQSASNHRYHTHDYYQVDPLLGGDAAFDALLAECKRRGLRVVLDGVFNHASRGFFQFNDVLENGAASPWLDWFFFAEHPANAYDHNRSPGYAAWWGLHALPKFNTDNPQVREYLMRVGEHWMRKGIDGWRLDVAEEIKTAGFWAEFRQRIKAINPEAYIVAEIWTDSREWLQGDQFDGVMNYLWTEPTIAFCAGDRVRRDQVEDRSYRPWPALSGVEYADRIDYLLGLYPWPIQLTQLNLLDSHDTARFITIAGDDRASVRLGTLLLVTFPGAPSIYYGDEIGLTGGRPDEMTRKPFPWDRPATWDLQLHSFYKQVIALRRAQPALRTGAYQRVLATPDVYMFARTLEAATLVVAVNVAEEPRTIHAPLDGLSVREGPPTILFGEGNTAERDGTGLRIALAPRSGIVLDVSASRL
jgi:cyclomaltodextrinase / maltogenic alpha-amylase / neopullulanase